MAKILRQPPNARGLGSIPHPGIRSHTPQLKILCAAAKTWWSQINKHLKKKKKSDVENSGLRFFPAQKLYDASPQ